MQRRRPFLRRCANASLREGKPADDDMTRSAAEIRAARQHVDAITAVIIVQALAYALGDAPSPAVRVKVG